MPDTPTSISTTPPPLPVSKPKLNKYITNLAKNIKQPRSHEILKIIKRVAYQDGLKKRSIIDLDEYLDQLTLSKSDEDISFLYNGEEEIIGKPQKLEIIEVKALKNYVKNLKKPNKQDKLDEEGLYDIVFLLNKIHITKRTNIIDPDTKKRIDFIENQLVIKDLFNKILNITESDKTKKILLGALWSLETVHKEKGSKFDYKRFNELFSQQEQLLGDDQIDTKYKLYVSKFEALIIELKEIKDKDLQLLIYKQLIQALNNVYKVDFSNISNAQDNKVSRELRLKGSVEQLFKFIIVEKDLYNLRDLLLEEDNKWILKYLNFQECKLDGLEDFLRQKITERLDEDIRLAIRSKDYKVYYEELNTLIERLGNPEDVYFNIDKFKECRFINHLNALKYFVGKESLSQDEQKAKDFYKSKFGIKSNDDEIFRILFSLIQTQYNEVLQLKEQQIKGKKLDKNQLKLIGIVDIFVVDTVKESVDKLSEELEELEELVTENIAEEIAVDREDFHFLNQRRGFKKPSTSPIIRKPREITFEDRNVIQGLNQLNKSNLPTEFEKIFPKIQENLKSGKKEEEILQEIEPQIAAFDNPYSLLVDKRVLIKFAKTVNDVQQSYSDYKFVGEEGTRINNKKFTNPPIVYGKGVVFSEDSPFLKDGKWCFKIVSTVQGTKPEELGLVKGDIIAVQNVEIPKDEQSDNILKEKAVEELRNGEGFEIISLNGVVQKDPKFYKINKVMIDNREQIPKIFDFEREKEFAKNTQPIISGSVYRG